MTHEVQDYQSEPTHEELLAPDFEYQLLVGHRRTDGSFKSTEQLQTEYVRLTDGLVHKMVDGVDVTDPETGETTKEKVDYVVWLDKSARPVSWLTRELWPLLASNEAGNVPTMPESRFVNIDRNQWTSSIDPQGHGKSDVQNIDQSIIRSLRSIFLANPKDRETGLTEAIDMAPTQFDGKTVLIVDEVLSSGRTLDYARSFFQRAFPDAKVAGTHWMGGLVTRGKGLAVGNADLPVWYSDTTEMGRGIGNRNVDLSLQSTNQAQRLGAYFLSTALQEPDSLSSILRRELHQLAEDTRTGKVFVEPSLQRNEADYDERALRLNNLDSFRDYIAQKRQHNAA
jgi:hypothetical protein